MILKTLIFLGLIIPISLSGCSSADDNNFDKIMRFEIENAKSIMDQSIQHAEQIAQTPTSTVHLDDFRSYPIYENYKKTHAALGLDVNQITYVKNQKVQQLEKVQEIESRLRVNSPNQDTEQSHNH